VIEGALVACPTFGCISVVIGRTIFHFMFKLPGVVESETRVDSSA
jgi:hypothetical protein